ncbi:MAG: V-type ATPase subunit [Candidatus Nanohaloarchaea archaeon]
MISRLLRSSRDYPYMYARVSAKKAKLLEERDYEDLIKMEPNQIAKRLEEGDYKEEIDELGARYEGTDLIELALNRNLVNSMHELIEMAPETLSEIINVYLRRFDILTLKRVLRAKEVGEEEAARDLLMPMNRYSFSELETMMEGSYKDLVEKISFPDSEVDYRKYIEGEDLLDVETGLDRAYTEELSLLCQKTGSSQFNDFIKSEIDHQNIITALRLKKYGYNAEEVREHLLNGEEDAIVNELMSSGSLEEAIGVLSEARDRDYPERLEDVEHRLEVERLRNALRMLHAEPLGATSILGYIVAKRTEVKNLRMLARARETKVQNPETIRSNLVIP